jgi:hypothetical protein
MRLPWAMTPLVARIREALCALLDARKGGNNQRYTMGDAGVCAFSGENRDGPCFSARLGPVLLSLRSCYPFLEGCPRTQSTHNI